jgi:hypothetical protein
MIGLSSSTRLDREVSSERMRLDRISPLPRSGFCSLARSSALWCSCPYLWRALRQRTSIRAMLPELRYFIGIGLGFILIEISQMQRLMIFLGDPVYGLSVVLFTLLLFGGIGSGTVNAALEAAHFWIRPLLLCFVLTAIGMATPWLTEHLRGHGAWVRRSLLGGAASASRIVHGDDVSDRDAFQQRRLADPAEAVEVDNNRLSPPKSRRRILISSVLPTSAPAARARRENPACARSCPSDAY